MALHSTTSQYGTLSRGPDLIPDEMKKKARALLEKDIKQGAFVQEWSQEQSEGSKRLKELKEKGLAHPMSVAEQEVIRQIQGAHCPE